MENKLTYFLVSLIIILLAIIIIKDNNNFSNDVARKNTILDYKKRVEQYEKISDSLKKEVHLLKIQNDSLINKYILHLKKTNNILDSIKNKNINHVKNINNVYSWDNDVRDNFWTNEFSRKDTLINP